MKLTDVLGKYSANHSKALDAEDYKKAASVTQKATRQISHDVRECEPKGNIEAQKWGDDYWAGYHQAIADYNANLDTYLEITK